MKRSGFDTMSIYKYPLYITTHPQDGFQEMKFNKKGSVKVASLVVFLWLLVELLYRTVTDYDLDSFYNVDISLFKVSIITVLMYVMVCISNWCFCTLLDGKGKMANICVVTAYSLIPYIVTRFVWVLLSRIFTSEEQILLDYCIILAKLWCFIIFFIGLREIHEYSVKKTALSIFLTIVGILIMLFLGMLFLMMTQQVYVMLQTIVFEIIY